MILRTAIYVEGELRNWSDLNDVYSLWFRVDAHLKGSHTLMRHFYLKMKNGLICTYVYVDKS